MAERGTPVKQPSGRNAPADNKRRRKKKYHIRFHFPVKQDPKPARGGAGQAAPRPRPSSKKRRRRHGRMTLNYILFSIVGIVLLAVLCYAVFFKVYHVTAVGELGTYSEQEIVDASGIQEKDSLFKVDQKKVFASVTTKLPYIKTVTVKKKFPTTVELDIAISKPVGVIESQGRYLYINVDGKILESNLDSYDRSYPLVMGISPSTTVAGNYVLNQNSEQLNMLRALLEALTSSSLDKISVISVADRLNMRVLYDNRLLIEFGTEADLAYKLKFVQSTIQNNLSSTIQGVLNVTMVDKKYGILQERTDVQSLLEEDQAAAAAGDSGTSGGGTASSSGVSGGIKVDPKSGAILVGPKNPLGGSSASSSSGDAGGSSSAGSSSGSTSSSSSKDSASKSSSSGSASSSSSKDSASKSSSSGSSSSSSSKGSVSKSSSSSSSKESSSKSGSSSGAAQGNSSGSSSSNSSKDSASKDSSSASSGYDKKKYLTI